MEFTLDIFEGTIFEKMGLLLSFVSSLNFIIVIEFKVLILNDLIFFYSDVLLGLFRGVTLSILDFLQRRWPLIGTSTILLLIFSHVDLIIIVGHHATLILIIVVVINVGHHSTLNLIVVVLINVGHHASLILHVIVVINFGHYYYASLILIIVIVIKVRILKHFVLF